MITSFERSFGSGDSIGTASVFGRAAVGFGCGYNAAFLHLLLLAREALGFGFTRFGSWFDGAGLLNGGSVRFDFVVFNDLGAQFLARRFFGRRLVVRFLGRWLGSYKFQ